MTVTVREVFSDFKTNFTIHPVSGDLARDTNLDAIKTSVKNLVLTNRFDRPFRPLLGSGVRENLFELFDALTEENIRDAIIETIENYEPRAELLDVQVNANEDRNNLEVNIIFRAVNNTKPTTLTVFLERIR